MGLIGIAQPTYLPWLGYFDAIDQVDEFVLLDDVQFERHSWQQRNRVKGPQGEVLLVVPVKRTGLETRLCDAEIANIREVAKHRRTVEQAYARADHRESVLDAIGPTMADPPLLLTDFTVGLIEAVMSLLGITTPLRRSSDLGVSGQKDGLVRSICDALDADAFLAAPGSRSYMEAGSAFADGAVTVRYHDFGCLPYEQLHGPFISHLSAIDAIMCVGQARTCDLMVAGRGQSKVSLAPGNE